MLNPRRLSRRRTSDPRLRLRITCPARPSRTAWVATHRRPTIICVVHRDSDHDLEDFCVLRSTYGRLTQKGSSADGTALQARSSLVVLVLRCEWRAAAALDEVSRPQGGRGSHARIRASR